MSNNITYRKLPPITDDEIRSGWDCVTPHGQKADLKHLNNILRVIERVRQVNQELCCTPLRHKIDEELCKASNTVASHIKEFK